MQAENLQARASLFYANLPERVRPELSRDQWISLALFIEQNLPQWSGQESSIFKKKSTGLPRKIVFNPQTKKAHIYLKGKSSSDSRIRQLVMYDVQKPLLQIVYTHKPIHLDVERVVDLLRQVRNIPPGIVHGDIKPPNVISRIPPPSTGDAGFMDYGFTYPPDLPPRTHPRDKE
jgi:hypothetical protein